MWSGHEALRDDQSDDHLILFHGTSTEHLPSILEKGLQPRDVTGQESNWEDDVESKPDLIYLTTAYPVYFAVATADEDHKPVVLKVRVKESDLFPDEDFVAKCFQEQERRAGSDVLPLSEYNPMVNPKDNKDLAEPCLLHNGIVAAEQIPPEDILGHIILEPDSRLMSIGGDSMPIPMNYMILGQDYRRYVEALFNGGIDAAMEAVKETQRERFGHLPDFDASWDRVHKKK